jgi:DNA primase
VISPATIDRIMQATVIEEVVGQFVVLKKSGSSYKGLSPFNNEKTPSFYVVPSKNIFKCFSSGKGGSAVNFLMEHEKMTYPEALRWLAAKYNIEIEETGAPEEDSVQRTEREALTAIYAYAQRFFQDQMMKTDEGRSIGLGYLRERGFRDDIIERFGCGYSPEEWDAFERTAIKDGHKRELLLKAGLIKEKDGKSYDFFRGRVIFPIHNLTGKVIAFGGRILRTDAKAPKYVNSPETELYVKSRTLYGLFQAKNAITRNDNCYLAEGYTDVMSLHQAGVENAVASAGTSLTEDQIRIIKRFTRNVTVLYDGDPAGIRASFRGIDMILTEGLNVKAVLFPEGDDPDSYSRKIGSEAFRAYLDENAKDFIAFKTDLLLADAQGDPIKRADLIRDIVRSVSVVPNQIQRAVYVQQCARLLDMDEALLMAETNRIITEKIRQGATRIATTTEAAPPEPTESAGRIVEKAEPCYWEEKELLRVLMRHGNVSTKMEVKEGEEGDIAEKEYSLAELMFYEILRGGITFRSTVINELIDRYREVLEKGAFPDTKDFLTIADPEATRLVTDLTVDRYELDPKWEDKHGIHTEQEEVKPRQLADETISKLQMARLKHEQDLILAELNHPEQEESRTGMLMDEYKRIHERRRALGRHYGIVISH